MSKSLLITGATGAIGRALAAHYASHGYSITLLGRNQELLAAVEQNCLSLGSSEVNTVSLDILDTEALQVWLDGYLDTSVPDLFIANAGVNTNIGKAGHGEDWTASAQLLDINVKATLLMTGRIAKAMKSRKRGQIALISSLAGYYGLPITPSYSASKAAVKAYGEAIRGWLAPYGVGVTVVMPGYIKSDMCDAMPGPKPFLWQPEKAAKAIVKGISKNKPRISFPFPLNFGTWCLMVLPPFVSSYFLRLLNYSGK